MLQEMVSSISEKSCFYVSVIVKEE
jgi:hypothetical protein